MPLFSNSPHTPGSAEDFTYKLVENAQERAQNDPNAGEATAAVANGLAYLLTAAFGMAVFTLPRTLARAARRVLAHGPLTRCIVFGALAGSGFALMVSYAMHDEIMRAQIRLVPLGAIAGLAVGVARARLGRPRVP